MADAESLLTQQPSANYMEAFEESDIAVITLSDAHSLMDEYPCFRLLNVLIAILPFHQNILLASKPKLPMNGIKIC